MTTKNKSIWKNRVFKGSIVGLLVVVLLTGIVMPIVFYSGRNSKRMPALTGYDPDFEPSYYLVSHDNAAAGVLSGIERMSGVKFPEFVQADGQKVRIPYESISVEAVWTAVATAGEGQEAVSEEVMIAHCLTYSKEGDKSVPSALYVLGMDGSSLFSSAAGEESVTFSAAARIRGYHSEAEEADCTLSLADGNPTSLTEDGKTFALTELQSPGTRRTYGIFEVIAPPEYQIVCMIKDLYIPVQEGDYYSITYFDESVWAENPHFVAVMRFEHGGRDEYVVLSMLSTEFTGADGSISMNELRIGDSVELTVQTTKEEFSKTLYTAQRVTLRGE